MNIPKKPRYNYCYEKACEFLEHYHIISYPIEPLDIINQESYGLICYSELMDLYNCSTEQVCKCMCSDDGKTIWDENNYTIAYNDIDKNEDRIRFTLMHELGHIFLNHLIDFDKTEILRCQLNKSEYKVLENEANAFARNVLAPIGMVVQLKKCSADEISHVFGLTHDATRTRLDFLQLDKRHINQQGLFIQMRNVFNNFCSKTVCTTCGAGFSTKYRFFCPICGSINTLKWGDGDKMKYTLLPTHENNKLKECPICQNEDTLIEGNFCQICGSELVNRCENQNCTNANFLPSNARYCPICGISSTFYSNGMLKAWNYSEPELGDPMFMDSQLTLNDLDEELPFN